MQTTDDSSPMAGADPHAWPQLPLARPSQGPAYFHVLSKPTGAVCNLDCKYCFFL